MLAYAPVFPPRAAQAEALRRIGVRPDRPSDQDVFALLMEMRTGKSKVILDEWGERVVRGSMHDLLVHGPAGAYGNWFREDADDPGEVQKHVDPRLRERLLVHKWVSGGGKRRQRELDAFLAYRGPLPRMLLMNVEALSTVARAREVVEEFLRAEGRRSTWTVDESTTIKNPRAKRTKFVLKAAPLADARRIMSGLVSPRSPMDLYAQFCFLDWRIIGCKSEFGYKGRFAVERALDKQDRWGRNIKIIVGFRKGAEEELRELTAPYSYRVLTRECMDVPPMQYARRDVEMTPEQVRLYAELKANATAAINEAGDHVTATMVVTQILRLDQLLCGHTVDEEGRVHDVPENKVKALLQLLEEHGGKAVVWTAYDPCVRKIADALRKAYREDPRAPDPVACYWGDNRSTRDEDQRRFKTDPACRFMVATPGAGGMGNTWSVADLQVFHSCTNNLEHRMQAEERLTEEGNHVLCTDLVTPGTVEEKKMHALRAKLDMAAAINGDTWREWLV